MSEAITTTPTVRWKSVALPAEHGGWGFLIEPMLLGMLVAPSWAGLWICLSALGVFLIHQPLRTALKDRLRGRRFTRTAYAERFAAAYGVFGLGSFVLALLTAQAPFWIPLLFAVPLAGVQLLYESRNRGRELVPEVSGALALGATAPAIVLAAGCSPTLAALSWIVITLRVVPSILYVRTRLSVLHGRPISHRTSLIAHVMALIIGGVIWANGLVTWTALLALVLLLVRAVVGLRQTNVPARTVGFQEMGSGLLYAVLGAIGTVRAIC